MTNRGVIRRTLAAYVIKLELSDIYVAMDSFAGWTRPTLSLIFIHIAYMHPNIEFYAAISGGEYRQKWRLISVRGYHVCKISG